MRELKRIFLSPARLLLLGGLLLACIMLYLAEDVHNPGFYRRYEQTLAYYRAHPRRSAAEEMDRELAHIQTLALLWRWDHGDDVSEFTAEELSMYYGEDFDLRLQTGELQIPDSAMTYLFRRQEVLQSLRDLVQYQWDYPDYLNTVHQNAAQMAAMSVFSGQSGFSAKNIEKTDRDFPTQVRLRLDNNLALEHLVSDQLGTSCLLVYVLAVVLAFLDERRRGLWTLIHAAPRGRAGLALCRAGILLLAAALGTLVIFGGKFVAISLRCGGWGDLSRTVQSSPAFRNCPDVMTVGAFLRRFFFLKVVGAWLAGLIVWAILQGVHHLPLAIAAAAVLLGAEYGCYRLIPDSYSLVILRYANLFALVDLPALSLHYLNVNLFGEPVRGTMLTLGLMPPLALLALGANLLIAARKKPVSRENPVLSLLDRLRRPVSRLVGRLGLLGQELYKLLWLQKGLAVLLAVGVFCFAALEAPYPDTELYNTRLAGLSASMAGPITQDTLASIDEKLTTYAAWDQTEAVRAQTELLRELKVKVKASLAQKDGAWLIAQAGPAALMSRQSTAQGRKNGLILLLALCLLLSGLFAAEPQNRITLLLRGSPGGRGRLLRTKLLAALVATGLLWLLFSLGELRAIVATYGPLPLRAPLCSMDCFAAWPAGISLGAGVLGYLLLRLLGLLAAAMGVLLISALCTRINTAMLAACAALVLPAALSYMGLGLFDSLSAARLLSPMACGPWTWPLAAAWILAAGWAVSRLCDRHPVQSRARR